LVLYESKAACPKLLIILQASKGFISAAESKAALSCPAKWLITLQATEVLYFCGRWVKHFIRNAIRHLLDLGHMEYVSFTRHCGGRHWDANAQAW
jgi:hypothetical protein